MTGEWIVFRSWGREPDGAVMGETQSYPFEDERKASLRYDELLEEARNGIPDGYWWVQLTLERRSNSKDPRTGIEYPGRAYRATRHHRCHKDENGEVHVNDFSRVV